MKQIEKPKAYAEKVFALLNIAFISTNRFQTDVTAKFSIIFFLRNIVSNVLYLQEIRSNYTGFKDAIDFFASYQNFSITEFVKKKNGLYLNNSTLLECDFFGKPCGPQDFAHVFTEYGNCFTFNYGENIRARNKLSVSGRGLSLFFNFNQVEFTYEQTLGFVYAGIIFVIHSPQKVPQIDGLGLSSPVGMHAQVTICQIKTVHQEYPWGECNPNIKLQNFSTYSTSGCLKECMAQHIQEQCGCLPFLLPGNGIECDLQKFYNCLFPPNCEMIPFSQYPVLIFISDYIKVKESCTMGKHNSSCPVPCEETEYPATISYSTFPSQKPLKYLSKKLNQSQEYISDLYYKITQQQKAVSVSELLDVGGQLDLFCGASMITIIEIIEYIFTNFYWICILFLLKIPQMTQGSPPPQHHLKKRNHIEEC
uniref:Acid sensing ion channel subunit family member 5 n=1 Tax=Panthera tigris altaica TaxID=74533 RepID=A0A8C9JPM4_PANTA